MKEAAQLERGHSQEATVDGLFRRIEQASPELGEHCNHVAEYSRTIAAAANAPYGVRDTIYQLGKIHDVGKTDDEIRFLLGIPFGQKITDEQYALFKKHAELGAGIAREAGLSDKFAYVIETHHEDFDGGGYPHHLQGDEIPLAAQVIRIADSFAAIVERKGRTGVDAYEDIMSGMGTRYNPRFEKPFDQFASLYLLHEQLR